MSHRPQTCWCPFVLPRTIVDFAAQLALSRRAKRFGGSTHEKFCTAQLGEYGAWFKIKEDWGFAEIDDFPPGKAEWRKKKRGCGWLWVNIHPICCFKLGDFPPEAGACCMQFLRISAVVRWCGIQNYGKQAETVALDVDLMYQLPTPKMTIKRHLVSVLIDQAMGKE